MDFPKYSNEFISKARDAGFSEENIQKCLTYAKPLLEKKIPVIYDAFHLASLVGYEYSYLMRAVIFEKFFYRQFLIKKANGTNRKIAEPLPSLKSIQTWILENILYPIKVSRFAKAYIPGITLKQNLVFHKDQPKVLNLDIKNFFPSIKQKKIEYLFSSLGYSIQLSNLLSKLCCLEGSLPQGAPTSAYLSNLVMIPFDLNIGNYCLENKIRYTRYADDLTFSGDFDHSILLKIVNIELKKLSFRLNDEKTKLMSRGDRQTVTGVVVNHKPQVVRYKRKEIRQTIYYIKKFGLVDHMKKIESVRSNYLKHLLGQILYILFINPEDREFLEYKSFLNSLIATNTIMEE